MRLGYDYILSFKNGIGYTFVHEIVRSYLQRKELRKWMKESYNSSFLPAIVKQNVLKDYADRFNVKILIETGTFLGDTISACRESFEKIISIEVDEKLSKKAKKKFSKFDNISILHGNSDILLPHVISNINSPCLFWLDAHYSGGITNKGESDTPILAEIKQILNHSIDSHIILIDDARCFGSRKDYPTICELKALIYERHPDWHFEVKDDIIRIHR